MKHFAITFVVFLFSCICRAQLVYPVAGTYKGKSAQGMAIWGNRAFLFNDGGGCRVLNLVTGEVTGTFLLASAGKKTHVNSACFGNKNTKNASCPIVYVSEYNLPSRCFVECVNDSSATLLQTIQAKEKDKPVFVQSWVVDEQKGWLYAIARQSPPVGEKHTKRVKISKYRLPALSEGREVVLSEKECVDSFFVEFASGTQGGKIKGKYLYIVSGLQEASKGAFNAERFIQVVDLKKRKLMKTIDLTYITTNEPEDMDFYKRKALLYAGQNGGLYRVNLK